MSGKTPAHIPDRRAAFSPPLDPSLETDTGIATLQRKTLLVTVDRWCLRHQLALAKLCRAGHYHSHHGTLLLIHEISPELLEEDLAVVFCVQ